MTTCRTALGRRAGGAALVLAFLVAGRLHAAVPIRPPAVEYRIEASLDPKAHVVDGKERLVWRNPSGDSVGELRFHLYLNAFKNDRSTFMRESGGQLRGDKASTEPGDWGAIDVLSMKTSAGADLLPNARKIQPDGNDAADETVLLVPLASPVPPHGEITLDITFRSKLPKIFARTGFVRDYHLVGQWFPKIGVYEPAGMRGRKTGAWNCHAFHANSEFYADYGDWDVTLSVPTGYVVGATGQRGSEEKRGDRTVYQYRQQNVHDFAWTADPRFVVREYTFDPNRDVPAGWSARAAAELGMSEKDIALKPIAVRVLLQPDHVAAFGRYKSGLDAGISYYGLWFGAYPYATLTLVDPPEDGFGSGGMEYPTFITGGTNVLLLHWPLANTRLTENVTLHEFGHQYWYGLVGSNEFEESWLDEGLNTDSEYRAMRLAYGSRDMLQFPGEVGISSVSIAHGAYADLPNLDPIRRFAWGYATGNSYGENSYMKVGLFLDQLSHDIGQGAFAKAQRAYFDQWSFRHPGTDDFFAAFERSTGRDLSDYRRNIVEGTARLDWQVVSAKGSRDRGESGMFDRPGGRVTLDRGKPAEGKKKSSPSSLSSSDPEKTKRRFYTVVVFANTGDWAHGAPARLVFEDGTTLDRVLPASARWVRLQISSRSPLAWAAVDPDRTNAWDLNRENDSKVLQGGRGAADTRSHLAPTKYLGWVAAIGGLMTELLWVLS